MTIDKYGTLEVRNPVASWSGVSEGRSVLWLSETFFYIPYVTYAQRYVLLGYMKFN